MYLTPPFTTNFPTPVNDTVRIIDGNLLINGKETYLYGGELQYFRIRDENHDADRTWKMWEETLDLMVDAGMNFVSFYIPWDYHELSEGNFDFSGSRDIDHLLDLCYERDFHVMVRPGPYIIAEWPNGPNSFGAVPQWFKDSFPETMQIKSDGSSHDQPTYLHPTFLNYTKKWFARITPILRKYIHDQTCIVMVQLDNEPNFLWVDHYTVDYSGSMIVYYRNYLERKYGNIQVLNADYGSDYRSFIDIEPPPTPPEKIMDNPISWDWFDSSQCYIIEYLLILRNIWEELGIQKNDILFMTNDGISDIPTRNILMWDGFKKNIPGLSTLDIYAKMWPTNGHLMDIPYSAGFFTKLFEYSAEKVRGTGGYSMGPEIQGGWWIKPPDISAKETEILLAKLIGHGLDGIGMYVMRGGFNMDNSVYDFQAPIDTVGYTRERYDVLEKFGKNLIEPYGNSLMASEDVENSIAVASYWPYMNPQNGVSEDMDYFYAYESAGLFGCLMSAGYNPDVIDLHEVEVKNLSKYNAIFFMNPGYLGSEDALKLRDYVNEGGNLVNFLWPGEKDLAWKDNPDNAAMVNELFPAEFIEHWDWWYPPFGDYLDFNIYGQSGKVWAYDYQTSWDISGQPDCISFVTDRSDNVVGYYKKSGKGNAYFLGSYLSANYNNDKYYEMDEEDISSKSRLMQLILANCGVERNIYADTPFAEVWARKPRTSENELFIFAVNNKDETQNVKIQMQNLSRLGLLSNVRYRLFDVLENEELGIITGQELLDQGLNISFDAYSAKIIHFIATYELPLYYGWNLISIPFIREEEGLKDMLTKIDGKYDIVQSYDPWDLENPWQLNYTYREPHFNDDIRINDTMGFWIHIPDDSEVTLYLEGSTPVLSQVRFKRGWNIVGYPSLSPRPVDEVLAGINWEKLQFFGGGNPENLEEMTGDDMMMPGEAYWLRVSDDCVLEIENGGGRM
ncbi:MAG: beta-galactosidase [Candidatus Thermoplasmatota archaeon]|nr:beta-galactosidase [Candidatus Thermoplasmatota archaeon]